MGVSLKSSHIHISGEIANQVFGRSIFAFTAYVEEQEKLLITPVSSGWFPKMYKPNQLLLKERNLKGDKTLAIHQLMIDHELDSTDRGLDFEVVEKTNLIKIKMK